LRTWPPRAGRSCATIPGAPPAQYFTRLAEASRDHLLAAEQLDWLRRLAADQDNLHAAVRHAVAAGDGPTAVALAAALGWYWFLRGMKLEGAELIGEAIRVRGATESADPEHLAVAYTMGALLTSDTPLPTTAADWLDPAQRKLGYPHAGLLEPGHHGGHRVLVAHRRGHRGVAQLGLLVGEPGHGGRYGRHVGRIGRRHGDRQRTGAGLEFFRGPGRDHRAVVDDRDVAGQLIGLLQVLGGEQYRDAGGGQAADHVPHLVAAARVTTSCPQTAACPPSGRSRVARIRTAVVFPAPFEPRRPNTEAVRTARSIPSSATVSPNRLTSPSASIEYVMPLACGPALTGHRDPADVPDPALISR
jgi:hypothetical protein